MEDENEKEKDAEKNTSKYEYDIKNYVGGETAIEKKNKAEAIGAAVFEKDKMVGELGEVETEICKMLKGDYTYSYLTYYNNDTPDIPITVKTTQQKKPKYKIDTDKKMTWEDDMRPEVYENLLVQYGKEIADKVPYLFDQDFIDSGNTFDGFYDYWDDEENPYFVIIMNTDMDLSYISKYKAHLLSEGYVTTDNKTFIKESDNLKLYVDEDNESNEFIHLYVLA